MRHPATSTCTPVLSLRRSTVERLDYSINPILPIPSSTLVRCLSRLTRQFHPIFPRPTCERYTVDEKPWSRHREDSDRKLSINVIATSIHLISLYFGSGKTARGTSSPCYVCDRLIRYALRIAHFPIPSSPRWQICHCHSSAPDPFLSSSSPVMMLVHTTR